MKAGVMAVVGNHFRPEFINRIDETIVFHPLNKKDINHIVNIQLQRLRERLHSREMTLTLSDEAISYLGDIGFDPVYGARPLKRAISHHVENPLAKRILEGKYAQGAEIKVTVENEQLAFG
jgi:ATP-dependent Clp protease ATP-binding subunit ClpB